MKKEKNYANILLECAAIAKERQEQYGMTCHSMGLASDILDTVFGIKLTKSQIAKVLISLKLSREKFEHKKDNILDTVNYLCISLNEREERDNIKSKK